MSKEIQYVSNTPDGKHCVQAAYMMIALHFDPSFSIGMDEWSELTAFDRSTWAAAGLLWFSTHGYDVHHLSTFNHADFVRNGAEYLLREFGAEVSKWQIANSNIPAEQLRTQQLIESGIIQNREPKREDIETYLDDSYLLRVLVNSSKLNNRTGYVGHSIVLFDYDNEGVTFHDPGLPPIPNRHISWDLFESAWADPNSKNKELDAIRLRTQ